MPRPHWLAALALVALGAGAIQFRNVRDQRLALSACDAAEAGDIAGALLATSTRFASRRAAQLATECRCLALLARGDAPGCASLLAAELGQRRSEDWVPREDLAIHLIQTWRDAGRSEDAARLAARASHEHPESADLFYLELVTRAAIEPDESALLRELAARIPGEGLAAARMRTSLATRYLQRGAASESLAALGSAPPTGGEHFSPWWETRAFALGHARDGRGLQEHFAAWERAGARQEELLARYAVTLSISDLRDPRRATSDLLETAFASRAALDPRLGELVSLRLVLALVNQGRGVEALARFDTARERYAMAGLARDELLRGIAERARGEAPSQPGSPLELRIAGAPRGAVLWLSPAPAAAADADYRVIALPEADGAAPLALRADGGGPGDPPLRWVLRDAAGAVLGSGTAASASAAISIRAGAPKSPPPPHTLVRRSGDGRRRIALVLLDCADWRIASQLRARGELPVLDALFAAGHRAVLNSDPPMTAAALESIVWPERSRHPSFAGWLHQLGTELAGLESVGVNPLAPLRWFLPASRDLFSTLGAGPLRVANLLFSHGGIDAGKHGIATGPSGRESELPLARASRDLRAEERARFPELAAAMRASERDAVQLRAIAAEMDSAAGLARDLSVDFFALRVEPLDLLTHAHFAELSTTRQDDGRALLYEVYRYLDARLAEVDAGLDSDDLLIVMSDHGIRTAMEHAPEAIFVAVGGELRPGRAAGTPDLRGVPFQIAQWLGSETTWTDTGIAPR